MSLNSSRIAVTEIGMETSELRLRFLSSIVLVLIAIAGAWWGGIATALVVAALVAIVHMEWTGVTEDRQRFSVFTGALAATMIVAGLAYLDIALLIAAVTVGVAAAVGPRPWRAYGVVYAAALGLSLIALRTAPDGLQAIAVLFVAVWATDIGAYFAGRGFGGPKLWPAVSPKKTWSGAIGGLMAALIFGLAIAWSMGVPVTLQLAIVVALLSIAGQAGDLFESFVKRRFGTKDAGTLIPGHGGLMDRVDGLVFAVMVAVAIGFLHNGANDLARGLIWW